MQQTATVPIKSVEDFIREGASLKAQIDKAQARLKVVNAELTKQAEFKAGKKTGHLVGAGYKVKVQIKETIKWDQERIAVLKSEMLRDEETREAMTATFNMLFQEQQITNFKPADKKVIDTFIESGPKIWVKGIQWARTVSIPAPSVTYERLEE